MLADDASSTELTVWVAQGLSSEAKMAKMMLKICLSDIILELFIWSGPELDHLVVKNGLTRNFGEKSGSFRDVSLASFNEICDLVLGSPETCAT